MTKSMLRSVLRGGYLVSKGAMTNVGSSLGAVVVERRYVNGPCRS